MNRLQGLRSALSLPKKQDTCLHNKARCVEFLCIYSLPRKRNNLAVNILIITFSNKYVNGWKYNLLWLVIINKNVVQLNRMNTLHDNENPLEQKRSLIVHVRNCTKRQKVGKRTVLRRCTWKQWVRTARQRLKWSVVLGRIRSRDQIHAL